MEHAMTIEHGNFAVLAMLQCWLTVEMHLTVGGLAGNGGII